MTLIPTNCWKIDRPIPTHTIGINPSTGPRTSASLGRRSVLSVRRISATLAATSISPSTRMSTRSASASLCRETRYRGDSGMVSASAPKSTAGTAMERNTGDLLGDPIDPVCAEAAAVAVVGGGDQRLAELAPREDGRELVEHPSQVVQTPRAHEPQ